MMDRKIDVAHSNQRKFHIRFRMFKRSGGSQSVPLANNCEKDDKLTPTENIRSQAQLLRQKTNKNKDGKRKGSDLLHSQTQKSIAKQLHKHGK